MSRVDLHVHTAASDGYYRPAEVVARAAAAGITTLAITDHDTVDGVPEALEAARRFPGLYLVPGVEISADASGGEVHILGYFIDYRDPHLLEALRGLRDSRWQRARRMVARLGELGFPLSWERVQEIAGEGGALGRPHIAQALVERGYVGSFREAFTRLIGHNCPAYVERQKVRPAEAVALVRRVGGLAVLAHPLTAPHPEALVAELKEAGLVGLEAYYAGFSPEESRYLASLARHYGLITTGGSDYHGLDDVGTGLGAARVPPEAVAALFSLAGQPAPAAGQPGRASCPRR